MLVEIDRMLRPEGTLVVRDRADIINKVAQVAKAVRWEPIIHDQEPESHGGEKVLVATKRFWTL